jgi:hypothetical protein
VGEKVDGGGKKRKEENENDWVEGGSMAKNK